MYDSLFFATFDPVYVNAPDTCDICISQPPIFNYEYCVEGERSQKGVHQRLRL
jgi:hypothetical protein